MAELLERVDSAELTEWMAYADMEPFGPAAEEVRTAKLLAMIHNRTMWGDKEKPAIPADFLPEGRPAPRQMSLEESREALKQRAQGG